MRYLALLIIAAACADPTTSTITQATTLPTVFVDPAGLHPDVALRFPDDFDANPTAPRPLILILHGAGNGTPALQLQRWGMTNLHNVPGGAFVLAPESAKDANGAHFWNASTACCAPAGSTVDDVGYLTWLAQAPAAAGWPVDRIIVKGHSNGGFMADRLGCERPDVFSVVVNVAGAARALNDPPCMTPWIPVHYLNVHGTADTTIPYTGGSLTEMLDPFPGVYVPGGTGAGAASMQQWRARNGCGATLFLHTPPGTHYDDLDVNAGGFETDWQEYRDCAPTGTANAWKMVNSVHVPTYTAAWALDLWTVVSTLPRR